MHTRAATALAFGIASVPVALLIAFCRRRSLAQPVKPNVPTDEDLVRLRDRYESRLAQAEQASLLEAAVSRESE